MGLTRKEIKVATDKEDWQRYRKGLKGLKTETKLAYLREWLDDPFTTSGAAQKDIQVLNYLNALSRGGAIKSVQQVRGRQLRELLANGIEIFQ